MHGFEGLRNLHNEAALIGIFSPLQDVPINLKGMGFVLTHVMMAGSVGLGPTLWEQGTSVLD